MARCADGTPAARFKSMARKVVIAAGGSVALAAAVLLVAAWPIAQERWRERELGAALALYARRCATAGETIFRRIGGVEGVLWMKWRGDLSADAFSDRFRLDDPYGHDCGLDECIARLLSTSYGAAS